ncbi:ATP-citrate synthase-like [Lytechinus pictus]|uniref:ATP-citrate synthase-like n=1 Tax=Lytechinus pictus TaxID=7653 RepID=UPI0030B9D55A
MTSKVITEEYGKRLLSNTLSEHVGQLRCAKVDGNTDWDNLVVSHEWLRSERLVVKPDQGLKRRGKLGLLKINTDIVTARQWIADKMEEELQVDGVNGRLRQFIIEPFVKHDPSTDEYYLSIYSELDGDVVLFHHLGGVDVGDVEQKALRLKVGIKEDLSEDIVKDELLKNIPTQKRSIVARFIVDLLKMYQDMHFTLLEINPLVVLDRVYPLDLAATLDTKATPMCKDKWGRVEFPLPFGRLPSEEERFISELEKGTPANVKLTVLNRKARIWSAISGGGISLLLGDTAMVDECSHEIGCYAQFSGPLNPTQMYGFTKTVLDLMLAEKHPDGKVLVTGSQAIDVTTLLANRMGPGVGMMKAFEEYKERLIDHRVSLYIRTTVGIVGPENEKLPHSLANFGIPVHVFGGEVPIADIIRYALGKESIPRNVNHPRIYRNQEQTSLTTSKNEFNDVITLGENNDEVINLSPDDIFTPTTRSIAIGMFPIAIQNIIGFDFVCSRSHPSIAAIVRPNSENGEESYPWGEDDISIPVYGSLSDAISNHSDVTVVLNQAIGPAGYACALHALSQPQVRCIMMMVGHISERQTRELIGLANKKQVLMIGPSTLKHGLQVNILKPGSFRCNLFGDIGGPLPDLVELKLYRQGSVVYLSRSGGLSTELCVSIARNSDGIYMGISLGGGRYTGSGIMDHIRLLHNNPAVKCFIIIGEVGGTEEYEVCKAIKEGTITKPVIAFCIGTCTDLYKQEPAYFGHTGGGTESERESAVAKNKALSQAGAIVPDAFDSMAVKLAEVYDGLAKEGKLAPLEEPPVPVIPANMKPARRPPVLSQ